MKACSNDPCANGARCVMSEANPDDYVCQCLVGYDGRTCRSEFNVVFFHLPTNSHCNSGELFGNRIKCFNNRLLKIRQLYGSCISLF